MRFFLGSGSAMGTVSAAAQTTFKALCEEVISRPIRLPHDEVPFFALPDKAQNQAKRVGYLTPAVFRTSPSPRDYEHADKCNLIALDIDDAKEAKRLLRQNWADSLDELGFIVWRTVRSTSEAPRLRLIVHAENIPVSRYVAAARTVGAMIGMANITSQVTFHAVQPMFLPTVFADTPDDRSPIVASNPTGEPFRLFDIMEDDESGVSVDAAPTTKPSDLADIAYLRTPLEGITLNDAASALAVLDPDMPMQPWIEVAASLKHQFDSADAYKLWDEWSAKGKKYVDSSETRYRWNTLKAHPADRAPVTIRSLFKQAQARGWSNGALTQRQTNELLTWIRAAARSTEELLDQGPKRIAKVGPTLGILERRSLLNALKKTLDARSMSVSLTDLKATIRQLDLDAAKASGVAPWTKGLCFVTSAGIFYRPSVDRRFTPEVLDLMYSVPQIGEDKTMRPKEYAIQIAGIPQVENLRYEPAQGNQRYYSVDGVPYVNTYRADYSPPEPERAEEAGEIWWDHLTKLVKEDDYRRWLMDFLAYPVQNPGKKMRWATLIQGGEGCGKTTIAVALKRVLGRRNVSKVSADTVLSKSWNDWAYGRQIVVMEEVRVIGQNRHAVMDKLKPLITDDDIGLQKKFEDHQTVDSCTNYLMFTNYQDALAVTDEGRRYFVIVSPLQTADDIKAIGGQAHFDRLYQMLRDNPGGLRAWFQMWKISPDFHPEGRAPMTPYLKEFADNAASPLALAVKNALEDEPHPLVRRDLLSLSCLRGTLDGTHLPEFSDQGLCAVLREIGWTRWDRTTLEGAKHQLWLKRPMADPRSTALMRMKYL